MKSINKLYAVQYNQLKMRYYNHIMERITFKHIETYLLQNTFISYIKYSLHVIHI